MWKTRLYLVTENQQQPVPRSRSHLLPSALGCHPSSVPRSSWETVLGKETKFITFGQRSHYEQNNQAVLLKLLLLTTQLEQKKMTVNHSLRANRRAEVWTLCVILFLCLFRKVSHYKLISIFISNTSILIRIHVIFYVFEEEEKCMLMKIEKFSKFVMSEYF